MNKRATALLRLARRHPWLLLALLLALAFYFAEVPQNPPGFFVDESSIAFNAHRIAQGGTDEHGVSWPLFFRAFGEYKSPLFIYLLAAAYKLTGPSIGVARLLSAVLGALAALLLGLLATRAARQVQSVRRAEGSGEGREMDDEGGADAARTVGVVTALAALLTPWLFEISRFVFEVALLPLALVLFLLALRRADERVRWTWSACAALAVTLALITYTYSGGRLLAPMLAGGLLLFVRRAGWRALLTTWTAYALFLVPLFIFNARRPGALGERFTYVTYITPQSTWTEIATRFAANYTGAFNLWKWVVAGDPEPRHHVASMGSLLLTTVVLAGFGLALALRRLRREAWWRFILYGLLVSPVPSALTIDAFHTLRLASMPVFLLLLAVPALVWLAERGARRGRIKGAAFKFLLMLMVLQGAAFRTSFMREAPRRADNFDAHYPPVFAAASARPERPVYLLDAHGAPGYIHAYWYGTLAGLDLRQFVALPEGERPPARSLVISTETPCADCEMILQRGPFRAYISR